MMSFSTRGAGSRAALLLAIIPALLSARPLFAQRNEPVGGRSEVFVGSELENYLRLLQVGGQVARYPWSIRAFSPAELDRLMPGDSAHPWAERYDLQADTAGGVRFDWVHPQARMIFNSAFPYGANNGPIWAGRGLTTAVQAGFAVRAGPLSLTVAPVLFRAENAPFPLTPNGHSGRLAFADWRTYHNWIDLPQRFGDQPYMRLDPGQSTLRIDALGVTAGVSTANQHWGPAAEHPIILGNNAPGFAHAFLGTLTPWNLWIGRLHGRVVWGRLEQSPYSFVAESDSRRFTSGLVVSFTPRGVPGLEIGGTRFYHEAWPQEGLGWANLGRPFEALLKQTLRQLNPDPETRDELAGPPSNQLASVFARWVFPASGFELYGEYGKEDHNWDFRDLVLQFDHNAGFGLGFRKVWTRSPASLITLRGELLNLQVTHILRVRSQLPFYQHSVFRQGHTHRGQILGSAAGYGGAGSILALDYYHPRGRWTLAWERAVRADSGEHWRTQEAGGLDVLHTLGAEALVFRGRWDVTAGLRGVYNLNRGFASDAFNLNATLAIRAAIR